MTPSTGPPRLGGTRRGRGNRLESRVIFIPSGPHVDSSVCPGDDDIGTTGTVFCTSGPSRPRVLRVTIRFEHSLLLLGTAVKFTAGRHASPMDSGNRAVGDRGVGADLAVIAAVSRLPAGCLLPVCVTVGPPWPVEGELTRPPSPGRLRRSPGRASTGNLFRSTLTGRPPPLEESGPGLQYLPFPFPLPPFPFLLLT